MIDRDWSEEFSAVLDIAINDSTTDFDSSQNHEDEENLFGVGLGSLGKKQSSDVIGSDSFSTRTPPNSQLKIIGREISATKSGSFLDRIDGSNRNTRSIHRQTTSLSPRKRFRKKTTFSKTTFSDITDLWNKHKSNSFYNNQSRGGCDDSTISTKTSVFNKHIVFDLLLEHRRVVKWSQAHILSDLPPPSSEETGSLKRLKQQQDAEESDETSQQIIHSKPMTVAIILMDVNNHRYEILQLKLNWFKSSVGDILKIIDEAIDENVNECFLPESSSSIHCDQRDGFDGSSHCVSVDSASECRYGSESLCEIGSQNSNNMLMLEEHGSLGGSLISKIELTSDQFQRLDAWHECNGSTDFVSDNKSANKVKEIWKVRYDGLLQCRSLPEDKPITMINCFGLMRYEVMPYEVFLAKPKGMSAQETTSHAEVMLNQLAEKGMIRRHLPQSSCNETTCSGGTRTREVLTTLSYVARSRIVPSHEENGDNPSGNAQFLTFSPPYDNIENIQSSLPPRCPKKKHESESAVHSTVESVVESIKEPMMIPPFSIESLHLNVENEQSEPQHRLIKSVCSFENPESPRTTNSPPISEPPSPTRSPRSSESPSGDLSSELNDYLNDSLDICSDHLDLVNLSTLDNFEQDNCSSEYTKGDTPLLSNTRKSFQVNEAVTLGSFDAAIRSSSSEEKCLSSDEDYQENERNIINTSQKSRRLSFTPKKMLPSRNAISCLAKRVKDKSFQKVIGGNQMLSVGYSKFHC